MSRLKQTFAELKAQNKTALIPFITAGDPNPVVTVPLMHNMVEAGASVIELGVPFSDPMADGPVIQRASERALEYHTSLDDILNMVAEFREQDKTTPVVLMGYANPIEIMGYKVFAKAAGEAGVDGVLTVDLPPEEAGDLVSHLNHNNIDAIYLLAPTSTNQRMERICNQASGFVYYVAVKGVTGSNRLDINAVEEKLSQIRQHTNLPLGVGFGIKTPETAAAVAQHADAVVVGSALVEQIDYLSPNEIQIELPKLIKAMRDAMDNEV